MSEGEKPKRWGFERKATTKRGKLSLEERKYIEQYHTLKSDVQIGEHLNRAPSTIEQYRLRYLSLHAGESIKVDEHTAFRAALHAEPEWALCKRMFTAEELSIFEYSYIALMKQFKGDVLPTEKKQIFHVLTTDIKIYRHNLEMKRAQEDLLRMEELMQQELEKKKPNEEMVRTLEGQIQGARAASTARSKEYKDLSDKFDSSIKALKGTREQRIAKIEENKETFVGLLLKLEDEDIRKPIQMEHVIINLGVKAEQERLQDYHKYMNGEIDIPILDSESLSNK